MKDNSELSQRKHYDFKGIFGENLDAANIVSFYDKVQEGKLKPVLPSAYSLIHLSELVDQKTVDEAFKN